MNFLKNLIRWFKHKYSSLTASRLQIEMVTEFPSIVKKHTVFIIKDGVEPDTLVFKCPCGCSADIYLNLLKDAKPQWYFYLSPKNEITIRPSIWRTIGCKSHFFINRGKVKWTKN